MSTRPSAAAPVTPRTRRSNASSRRMEDVAQLAQVSLITVSRVIPRNAANQFSRNVIHKAFNVVGVVSRTVTAKSRIGRPNALATV